jgi:hypothetical protein
VLEGEGAYIGMKCRRGIGNTGNFSYHLTAIPYDKRECGRKYDTNNEFQIVINVWSYSIEAIFNSD